MSCQLNECIARPRWEIEKLSLISQLTELQYRQAIRILCEDFLLPHIWRVFCLPPLQIFSWHISTTFILPHRCCPLSPSGTSWTPRQSPPTKRTSPVVSLLQVCIYHDLLYEESRWHEERRTKAFEWGRAHALRDHCKRAILFLSSSKILTPMGPIPLSARRVCPPPRNKGGGGTHSPGGEGDGGGDQYSGRREE